MEILYVVGNNLQENTSANISHNAFVRGLIENGHNVEILMKSSKGVIIDKSMPRFNVTYYEVSGVSILNRLANFYTGKIEKRNESATKDSMSNSKSPISSFSYNKAHQGLRNKMRVIYYGIIHKDGGPYENHIYWINRASKISFKKHYDLVISNSTPNSAHKVVQLLFHAKKLKADKWIQIWEDPWFFDLYGKKTMDIKQEEEKLLEAADLVYYVSPLTLSNQQKSFVRQAKKMRVIPLPSMENKECVNNIIKYEIGYFGDYHEQVRNIIPLFNACRTLKLSTVILGNTNVVLAKNEMMYIHERVGIEELNKIQGETNILVHLSNLHGGQIPGKIYHYANTSHPILFILDGSEDEKRNLYDFFRKYDRFEFCENNEEDIIEAICRIKKRKNGDYSPLIDFQARVVVNKLISEIKNNY